MSEDKICSLSRSSFISILLGEATLLGSLDNNSFWLVPLRTSKGLASLFLLEISFCCVICFFDGLSALYGAFTESTDYDNSICTFWTDDKFCLGVLPFYEDSLNELLVLSSDYKRYFFASFLLIKRRVTEDSQSYFWS
jgi:hypothetical protein